MTELDLDAIEAQCNAATPGPWALEGTVLFSTANGKDIGEIDQEEDRFFITAARTNIPRLVAEARRLRWDYDEAMHQYDIQQKRACEAEAEIERLRAGLQIMAEADVKDGGGWILVAPQFIAELLQSEA